MTEFVFFLPRRIPNTPTKKVTSRRPCIWVNGKPVVNARRIFGPIEHLTTCALNATGHTGPCTCKPERKEA